METIAWQESFHLADGIMNDGTIGPMAFEEGLELPEISTATPGNATVTIVTVSDSDSYSDLIDMSIEASVQYNGGFASGGGGIEASYLASACSSASAVHLTINSSWLGDPRTFGESTRLRLSEQAKELLRSEGPSAFEATYGRYYIHGCKSGAWYHAVMSIVARDSQHKSDIAASLNANFNAGMGSGRMAAKLSDAVSALEDTLVIDLGPTARNELRRQMVSLSYLDKAMDDMLDNDALNSAAKRAVREMRKPLVAAKMGLEEIDWSQHGNVHSLSNWLTSLHAVDDDRWAPLFIADALMSAWNALSDAIGTGAYVDLPLQGRYTTADHLKFDDGYHQRLSSIRWHSTHVHAIARQTPRCHCVPRARMRTAVNARARRFPTQRNTAQLSAAAMTQHQALRLAAPDAQILGGPYGIHAVVAKYMDGDDRETTQIHGDFSVNKYAAADRFADVTCTLAPDETITEMTFWLNTVDDAGGDLRGPICDMALVTSKGQRAGPLGKADGLAQCTTATVRVPSGATACGLYGSYMYQNRRAAGAGQFPSAFRVPDAIGLRYRTPWSMAGNTAGRVH
ncbi:hypothetical protein JKP88DRAFT_254543 [Tribonema minus]|uniref:Uncharacterized protein n=1 Tax=Tribonema minus TaxID=303371 RepID=A0A836CK97_9STRA|nr:hypothetical protein JKP88DRAFT_254543 [Tribonema minus]